MSVGYSATKTDFDSRAGQLATALRAALYNCQQFSQLLQSSQWTDSNLIALGYTQAEVTLLKAAFTDFTSLYNIAHANGTLVAVNDFFFNGNKLMGVVGVG
ncbi:MAG TPA: hypothetical protein VEM32_06620 [Geobacteraceae bacterium]|nr:hypothetical protein [Geobacteraceae bacterium]